MSSLRSPKPRYATIDPKNPSALGICDDSDFVFNRKDLVPQLEWRGNQLVPTGFVRGKPFLDEPQPQNKIPPFLADPYPVKDPRLPQPSSSGYIVESIPQSNEEIIAFLQQQTFGVPTPNPETNPNAPQGAPDGIPVPDNVYESLKLVTFWS